MKKITITWQRLVDDQGQTCERCAGTEAELEKAVRFLEKSLFPAGLGFVLEKQALTLPQFSLAPLESNRIFVEGRPLEEWLGAATGTSPCCGPCGDTTCRTVEVQGAVYDTVPAELVIQAALLALQQQVAAQNRKGAGGVKAKKSKRK